MDEKAMLALNLGAKLAKQIDKRINAPVPGDAALEKHLATVTAPVSTKSLATAQTATGGSQVFFDTWDAYYPRIVSLLGWASWVIPGPALTVIKSLLAVMNNEIIPILRQIMK